MASTIPSESTLVRRVAASRKLEKQIPRINLISIIIRVAQFIILGGFSLAYAMAQPPVFLDTFVWPQNTSPPYTMTVYRNTTSGSETRVEYFGHQHRSSLNYSVMTVEWNDKRSPPGLSEKYDCGWDLRLGCEGAQWAATRIGWLDSWPFDVDEQMARIIYIDRYIFWLLVVGGYLGSSHNVVVMIHALEPSGVGFYKYIAIMDFIISILFLLLGIFPIAIQQYLSSIVKEEQGTFGTSFASLFGLFTSVLNANEQYAFCMGWTLWALYTVTFLLSTILVRNLERYESLPKRLPASMATNNRSPPTTRATAANCRAIPGKDVAPAVTITRRYIGPSGNVRN